MKKTEQGPVSELRAVEGLNVAPDVINPDYVKYTRQLGKIADWIALHRRTVKPADDHIRERLVEIENHLDGAAHNIAELVAIEFQQSVYYKEV